MYVLVDVIAYTPSSVTEPRKSELKPEEYLTYLFSLVSKLRGGEDRFQHLLLTKVHQTLPSFSNPLTRPLHVTSFLQNSASPSEMSSSDEGEGYIGHEREEVLGHT